MNATYSAAQVQVTFPGGPGDLGGFEFVDLLAMFARDQQRRGLRPATITTRRRILWSLEHHTEGAIVDVTADEIDAWLDSCKLNPRSRYTYLSTVASFFEFLNRQGVRVDDPTRNMPRPRLPRLRPRPASASDVEYAITNAEPMMKCWLSLAAYEGLRCCEIAVIRREDVLDTRTPPRLFIPDGKGGRQDSLTLNDQVELALREYGMPKSGYLWLTRDGHPYTAGSVSRYIGNYLRSVSVDATAHRLRHLFVSTVWEQTKDIRVTQESARHADPKTTAGYAEHDAALASTTVRNLRLVASNHELVQPL